MGTPLSHRIDRVKNFVPRFSSFAISLLLWAASALGNDSCRRDFPHDFNPSSITDNEICNFHQVDAEVFRGARPTRTAYPKLVKIGIRTIISLEEPKQAERERAALAEFNRELPPEERIRFISFPITETEIFLTGVSDEGVHVLFRLLREAPKPVLIHCYRGKDRTGAVVALYRVSRKEKSLEDAYREAYHYKFDRFAIGLRKTMARYKDSAKAASLLQP